MAKSGWQWFGGVALVTLMVCGGSGCGSSKAQQQDLASAIDELTSVGSPDGSKERRASSVSGCDDDAEMPTAHASYDLPGEVVTNTRLEEVGDWYLPHWEELGWSTVDGHPGAVSKEVGGTEVEASIDADGDGYAVIATVQGGSVC